MSQIEQQDFEFLQAFWTRRAVIAYSIFALNIIIFFMMSFAGGSENSFLAFGAKVNSLIDHGEIWRLVTPIFLHIGFLHLAFNSYALWVIGPQVEKLYGGPRFLLLYLLTGIGGAAASYWYHPDVPSAGASGAIFGLLGVLLVFSVRYRRAVPAFFSRALGKGILLTVGINLIIGWQIKQVDNAAHVGGLISGGLLALLIPFARPGEEERRVFKVIQPILVLLIAVSFFQVAVHYNGPPLSLNNLKRGFTGSRLESSLEQFITSVNKAEAAFENSEMILEAGDLRRLPDAEREIGDAIDLMNKVPKLDNDANALSAQLLDLLRKQYDYIQEVQRTGHPRTDFFGTSPQSGAYKRLTERIDEWAAAYGYERPK